MRPTPTSPRRAPSRSSRSARPATGCRTAASAEIGGKGLFTKEIEEALLDGRIDLAVHSLKDVETWLPDGLEIACVLPRDDPRDAFLSAKASSLAALPKGARVGTASLRRQAQLLRRRPDLRIVPIRGNVNTRMRKLDAGEVDALVLALCGLATARGGELATEILSREIMLPAVGQGALAIECRAGRRAAAAAPGTAPRSRECRLRRRRACDACRARRLLPHPDRRAGRIRRRPA